MPNHRRTARRPRPHVSLLAAAALAACHGPAPANAPAPSPAPNARAAAAALSPEEARLRTAVGAHYDDAVALLQRAVDIPSGTHNVAGVRRVGELFAKELQSLGFETRWAALPDSMRRAGHLVAVHRGTRGPRLLLIGHLDTVFEGENQRWVREDTVARGAGSTDMKGGDVAMLLALRALADAGQLADMYVTVVMTGDEELPARPLAVARAALVDAAKQSDLALAFEGGSPTRVAIGRRGTSQWTLRVRARQAHSSGIFAPGVGYGAVYEGVRIIDEWRRAMAGERGLTFNVGLVGGGERVQVDSTGNALEASGKDNIIPPTFLAWGDLRFLRDAQRDSARARMQAIVAGAPLPGATAELWFEEGYPAMAVTPQNERLLALFDGASRALGYPSVGTTAPENRGAGDVSFVAPYIPGIDGLGTDGRGSHSPEESVSLPSLRMAAERAALFMARLAREWPRGAM
jgi:glutamate carboxypeptidase